MPKGYTQQGPYSRNGIMKTTIFILLLIPSLLFSKNIWVDASAEAHGNGSQQLPVKSIKQGLKLANSAGDTLFIKNGIYFEALHTQFAGTALNPIVIAAAPQHLVEIRFAKKALKVDHPYISVENIIFNGLWGQRSVVDINASYTRLINCEVKNSQRDLVSIDDVNDILIKNCTIHHGLSWHPTTRKEPHGISTEAVKGLTISGCEIYQITGDCIQISPTRSNWDKVLIEETLFWVAPLTKDEVTAAGLPPQAIGSILAENAIDTKSNKGDNPDSHNMRIEYCTARGFKSTRIKNAAAFNIKNPINCYINGVTVSESHIAFRLRAPAKVRLENCVVYNNDFGIRFESALPSIEIYFSTFAGNNQHHFKQVGAFPVYFKAQNNLITGIELPNYLLSHNNMKVLPVETDQFFIDYVGHNFILKDNAPAINMGVEIENIMATQDRAKNPRRSHNQYDMGAYEHPTK